MSQPRLVYILVKHKRTGEVAKKMGPMTERKAEKVELGLLAQIDRDNWYVGEELADPKLTGKLV